MYTKTLIVVHLISLTFLCLNVRPLVKMADQRVALFIVISKTIGSFLKLLFDLMDAVNQHIQVLQGNILPGKLPDWYYGLYLFFTQTMLFALYGHIAALAFNRLIGIFWPFEYSAWMSKIRILAYCSAIWLLSMCFTLVYMFAKVRQLLVYVNGVYLVFSIGTYLMISLKLLWVKYTYHNFHGNAIRQWRAAASSAGDAYAGEKNAVKISLVCFLSLCSGLIFLTLPLFQLYLPIWTDWLRELFFMLMMVVYDLIFCSEELCLFLLIAELRALLLAQLVTTWRHVIRICAWKNRRRIGVSSSIVVIGMANNNNNSSSHISNNGGGALGVLSISSGSSPAAKKRLLFITMLFVAIAAAFYSTFTVAFIDRDFLPGMPCVGKTDGFPCLISVGADGGCPPNGSLDGTYYSECDLFVPWLSGKALGCRQRIYTAVASCFQFGGVQYGSKYLCCP